MARRDWTLGMACVGILSLVGPARAGASGDRLVASQRATVDVAELARTAPGSSLGAHVVPRPSAPRVASPGVAAGAGSSTEERPSAPSRSRPSSPPPSQDFEALGDDGTAIPPDTIGAAGPNHLMVTLNTQVRIQTRTGATLATFSLGAFWSSIPGQRPFDPRVLYDPNGGRWIFVAMSNARTPDSSLLVGVSQTSDPTGEWFIRAYRIDDVEPVAIFWGDFPSVGFNRTWIVVNVNMFRLVGDIFDHATVYAFDKADLYAGGAGGYTPLRDTTGLFTLAPAATLDASELAVYLVAHRNDANGEIILKKIVGGVDTEGLETIAVIRAPNGWAFSGAGGADFAPQLGSSQKIDAGDARMQNCVFRNGSIWCVHTVFLPASSPTRSAVQWWKLSPSGTIEQRALIDDPVGDVFYGFPSIAVNENDAALIGFSRFSQSFYAQAAFAFRTRNDPPNTFQEDVVLKAGTAPYYKTLGGTSNRWGDYSGTVVDPANDVDFWSIQEYAASPDPSSGASRWGTWWGRVGAPAFHFSQQAYTVGEGGNATITVVREGDTALAGSVSYATMDDTATSEDYTAASGALDFASGETTRTFVVTTAQDGAVEPEERVTLALSAPGPDSGLGRPSVARLGIRDDEPPMIRFASDTYAVRENAGQARITVVRWGDPSPVVSVDYSTADDTAEAGADYTPASGPLTFGSDVTNASFGVVIVDDSSREKGQTVTVALDSPTGATLGDPSTASLVIRASDQQPDGMIRESGDDTYVGGGIYNTTAADQTRVVSAVRGTKRIFFARAQNDGNVTNAFRLGGTGSSPGFSVRYFLSTSSTDITSAVVGGTYTTGRLAPGAFWTVRIEIYVGRTVLLGTSKGVYLSSSWTGDGTRRDLVKSVVKAA